jgi:S-(hydroxymethyl)glutathione dehydrogenase/alcohol dehydrogenase
MSGTAAGAAAALASPTMRAALYTAENQPLAVEEVEPLPPGPRDVVIQVGASGVCHTDVSVAKGWLPIPPPCILGHEGAGTVLEVGSQVTRVRPGDRVVACSTAGCGDCWYCVHDQGELCEEMFALGFNPRARRADGSQAPAFAGLGTFADTMTVHEVTTVKVETDLPDEQLALIGCGVTTGVGAALNTARISPGSSVAVVGCGGVGQSVIQGARIAGAARIIAVDPVELKRKAAEQQGATDLVDPTRGDPAAQVKALTAGRGADYAFEVLGRPDTMAQAIAAARRGGTVVIVGMPKWDDKIELSAFGLFYESKRLLGCVAGSAQVRRDVPRLVDLAETGRLDLNALITRRIKLDGVNDAFRAMEAGEVIRSVILP